MLYKIVYTEIKNYIDLIKTIILPKKSIRLEIYVYQLPFKYQTETENETEKELNQSNIDLFLLIESYMNSEENSLYQCQIKDESSNDEKEVDLIRLVKRNILRIYYISNFDKRNNSEISLFDQNENDVYSLYCINTLYLKKSLIQIGFHIEHIDIKCLYKLLHQIENKSLYFISFLIKIYYLLNNIEKEKDNLSFDYSLEFIYSNYLNNKGLLDISRIIENTNFNINDKISAHDLYYIKNYIRRKNEEKRKFYMNIMSFHIE